MDSSDPSKQPSVIPISALSPKDRENLRRTLDTEITSLQEHLISLRVAIRRLETSKAAIKKLQGEPLHQQLLIPLTQSIYVPGTLDCNKKVLIDLGTGYYVEKTIEESEDYFQRKLDLLNTTCSKALKSIAEKRQFIDVLRQEMITNEV